MALVALAACLTGSAGPAAAAGGATTPQTAVRVTSLPFHEEGYDRPHIAGTGAANAKVATACNSGHQIFAPRWFTGTTTNAGSLVAQGSFSFQDGRYTLQEPSGIAVLSANLDVLDCNVAGSRSANIADRPATVIGSGIPAGTKLYVVHFAFDAYCGVDDPEECDSRDAPLRNVSIFTAPGYPAGDDWRTAVPITKLNTAYPQNTALATRGDGDLDCTGYYEVQKPSVWWTFTPTTSGPLQLGPGAEELRLAELTAAGPKWLPEHSSDDGGPPSGCQDYEGASGQSVVAGKTYLIYGQSGQAPVKILGPALAKPDLVVSSVTSVPAAPKFGDPVTFRVTIKNQGTAPTPGGVTHGVGIQVDGVRKVWSDHFAGSLAAGASVTLTADGGTDGVPTWAASPGSHVIKATVDEANLITEASESNNTRSGNLAVSGAVGPPDLVVTSVSAAPSAPGVGAPVKFSATIKNTGPSAAPAGTTKGVAFAVDGATKTWSRGTTSAIPAGGTVTVTADGGPSGSSTWAATKGLHTVTATVDDQSLIQERDETNNQRQVQLRVGAVPDLPDLVVTGVSWTPTSPAKGAPVRFTAIVKNVGTRSTQGTVIGVSFRPNGASTGATSGAARTQVLLPGESALVIADTGGTNGQWTPPAGKSTPVVVTVDDGKRITESNELDNTLGAVITVK